MEDQLGEDRDPDGSGDSSNRNHPLPPAKEELSYYLPSVELLNGPDPADALQITADDLLKVQESIVNRLASLGVDVIPGDITCGCNITRYEIYPAMGVGVETIRRHKQDIAMATRAEQFTLLAPVPGKESVGIEIPNKQVQKVTLRELLESDEWFRTEAGIPLLLGRDIYSQPVIVDLEQLPHLLIAGNIGSGKSVCLHAIIACLLYRFAPDQLRLIIIDPDVLEMQIYNTLPHLVVPVLTDSKKALLGLRFVITEIDQRYKLVAKAGVRDIAGFNARSASSGIGDDGTPQGPLSVMVVIVTELYSLLFDNAAEFEQAISLIAKKGHIVGVHLIAATRVLHPEVIRPTFKLNIPSRVAFLVSKEKDSLILLDEKGAEQLLGQGDMLYRPPDSAAVCRIQGTFIGDDEIRRLVDFVSCQAMPDMPVPVSECGPDEVSEEDEELVQQCIEFMKQERQASISLFQRRLRLGYTRAARIIDILEQRGYIGSGDGAKPREILVALDDLI